MSSAYPRPWLAMPVQNSNRWRVVSANGKPVATLMTLANAKLIANAVNYFVYNVQQDLR